MLQRITTGHSIAKMGGVGELVQVITNAGQIASQATDLGTNVAA
ncbi:hypothetical protein AA103581_1947 [Gluconobacter wancherniae NBRC 103581]|nr:hypothetical protein AA103581_1947 [Gluconobacter wancherniae NBRC 103581]